MNRYKKKFPKKFSESLRFSDLRKDAGISDLTKKFKKGRTKKLGSASNTADIVDITINRKQDYIDFIFSVPVTPYPNPATPDITDMNYQHTDPPDWELDPNRTGHYIVELRVLDFFSLLNTTPDKITKKDIDDVLNVADVKVACSCPSFNWQGFAYKLTTFDASIYPQSIPDPVWGKRHNDNGFLCKHSQGVINNIKFFIPIMRQMIRKEVS